MRAADRWFVALAGLLVLLVWQIRVPAVSEAAREPITVAPLELPSVQRSAVLMSGETIAGLFAQLGAAPDEIVDWVSAAASLLNLRALPAGLEARAVIDHFGDLRSVRLLPDWRTAVVLERGADRVVARRESLPVERELVVVEGRIDSSLFEAVAAAGETEALATELADLFQWDIDFHRELQSGDTFELLVERVRARGRTVAYGPILAAAFVNNGRRLTGIYYAPEGQSAGYYDEKGRPLAKQFLRSPLRFTRITSRFSRSRLHPVLGRRMPHWGVDYHAPVGTPVMVTASGTVVFRGWKGGGGNTVEVRHANGYVTGYLHLSRFASGLHVGEKVQQGEVIAFSGATGLATGPHLDYRVWHSGAHINPLTLGHDPAPPLPPKDLPRFETWAGQVLALLDHPGTLADGTREALAAAAPVRFDG